VINPGFCNNEYFIHGLPSDILRNILAFLKLRVQCMERLSILLVNGVVKYFAGNVKIVPNI